MKTTMDKALMVKTLGTYEGSSEVPTRSMKVSKLHMMKLFARFAKLGRMVIDKIPNSYIEKYGVKNLFRVELPNYWRLIYTLTEGETQIEIVAFVLDIFDHKDYNKRFGYKKK